MEYSIFLDEDITFDKIERLDCDGGTCEAYMVHIEGRAYFMKRLCSQYSSDPNYRLIFKKEFEKGCIPKVCGVGAFCKDCGERFVAVGEKCYLRGIFITK